MCSPERSAVLEAYVKTWMRLLHRDPLDYQHQESGYQPERYCIEPDEDPMWAVLPDILLEEIFSYLKGTDRLHASCVCKHWNETFFSPRLWEHYEVGEKSFVIRRQSLYKSYQCELSSAHAQMCLLKVGQYFRTLIIKPLTDYYNLYEFFHVLNNFIEYYADDYPLPHLTTFLFSFACETRGGADTFVHGTGGKILTEVKRLLGNLKDLKTLQLNQLLLDVKDAYGLLDSVVNNCGETLEELEILNCTKDQYPYFHVALFQNLKKLVITPQQLSQDVVAMLPSTSLRNLVIVQDGYTEHATPVSGETWREVKRLSPHLKVRLEVRGASRMEIIFQSRAPVHEIVYNSPYSKVNPQAAFTVVEHYCSTLRVFGHLGLPRAHMTRSFNDRADTSLVMLVRCCTNLHTLVVRETVSTCTLIVLAKEAIGLRRLYVRRNAILKRFDWPKSHDWSTEFYSNLKANSLCYDLMEAEVSHLLGYKWQSLTDKEFKRLVI